VLFVLFVDEMIFQDNPKKSVGFAILPLPQGRPAGRPYNAYTIWVGYFRRQYRDLVNTTQ
jgi:hypothetical protein